MVINKHGNFQKPTIFLVLIVLLVLTVLATLNTSHAATPLYVNGTSGNDSYDGTTPTWISGIIGPKKTIQNASDTVDTGGTVNLAEGIYNEHITLSKNMTLIGSGQDKTFINGTNNGRVITINSGISVNITGVTITNGSYSSGAGIINSGNLTIVNTTMSSNQGTLDGGAICNYGTLYITNSILNGNHAFRYGGAIYNTGSTTIINSTLNSNTGSQMGGAIYNIGITTITNSTLNTNHGWMTGGAVFNYNTGTTTITQSTLIGNHADWSGGTIYNLDGIMILHYNRIYSSSPEEIIRTTTLISAENNWWGSNLNPSSQFVGTVNYSPWLYMNLTTNPTFILNGATSTLTANFNNVYDGSTVTAIDPASGHMPDGTGVTFTTDLGSVGSKTTTRNTNNGIATATLTADESIGPANVSAQLDDQTLNAIVAIETLYVNGATGNDSWDGSNPNHISGTTTGPMKTIQTAVNAITGGGKIYVASDTYNEHLTINKSLNLIGADHDNTIIDGTNNGRVICIDDNMWGDDHTVIISNFTIRNGKINETSTPFGGAIINFGALTLNNCTLTSNNATYWGGAICNYDGHTLIINNSTLTGNTADGGGAIYSGTGTVTTITNSTLNENNSTWGNGGGSGGAICNSGTLTITNSTLNKNHADLGSGGAIANSGTATITNNTLNENIASSGGAISNSGTCTITDSTLTGNTATYNGGAIRNSRTLTITNSTLTGNTASSGGALYNSGSGEVVNIHFNRVVGNLPNAIFTVYTVINAENNWWGSNSDPTSQFTSQFTGAVNYSPWFYMTLTANPNIILNEAASTLTANFNNAYDGTTITPLNPANGHVPNNSVLTFTTDLGSVGSHTTTKNTNNGIATAILTANEGTGTANITAQLDSQTLTTTVEITNTLYVNGATGDDKWDGLSPTFITGTTNGPKQTIQNALETLNNAGIDGTVNVAEGTYTENLAIETNTNLIGNNTIINAPHPEDKIITIGKVKNTLISNFTIQGATNGIAILIGGGIATIKDNNIFNNDIGIRIEQELKPSTISQNNIKYNNIGISTASNTNINYNSLLENNIDIYSEFDETINATHNWWGSNSEPTGRTEGKIEYNPWLILSVNATPTLIKKDSISTITADLNHDSDKNPVTGHIINQTPITFTTTLGTINSPQYTTNGTTQTTLNGGPTSGTADITTTLDNEEIHTYVTVDATTPYVASIDPKNYAVNVAPNKVIKITFMEDIKEGNLNLIQLKNSTGTLIPTTISITGKTLSITPTNPMLEDKYLLLVYAGYVTDLAGNPAVATAYNFIVGTSPTVTSTDPSNYAVCVASDKVITVTFSEPIKMGNNNIQLKTNTGTVIPITKTITGNTLTITPTNPLTEARYVILIYAGAVTDLVGNPVASKTTSFSVGTSPTVTTTDPANYAVNVPTNKIITVTFNEPIVGKYLTLVQLKTTTGLLVPTTKSVSGNTLTITPTNPLAANTRYLLMIYYFAVTDLSGNPNTNKATSFTTGTT